MNRRELLQGGLAALASPAISSPPPASGGRVTIALDGRWQVGRRGGRRRRPRVIRARGGVARAGASGAARLPGVDQYETLTYLKLMVRRGMLPESELCRGMGRTRQTRNYFWHRKSFRAPARRQLATLVVNKAQFGTAVWLNGRKIGEHLHCFTAGRFDLTPAMNWAGENELVIRIGAHPGVMPPSVMWGNDVEKLAWTPGIYDSVTVLLADNPSIESIQVAPQIARSEIVVQIRIRNSGPACNVSWCTR